MTAMYVYKNFGGKPIAFSSPVNYGSTAYFEGASPSSVKWVLAEPDANSLLGHRPDNGFPVSAKFLCYSCNDGEGLCQNGGTCDLSSGNCVCGDMFGGTQCEYALPCRQIGCPEGFFCSLEGGACEPVPI